MSIIGPRPLLVRYLPFYTEEESHRHSMNTYTLTPNYMKNAIKKLSETLTGLEA